MKKMLVADDSVTIQKVIALTFSEEPVEIQSVGSGSDALEKIKEWRPDIILADVIMPQVNGYELSKAVKDDEETKDIPVLLLAGTFEAFDEEEARSAGADDFITKPFESGELIEKVNGLIGVPAMAQEAIAEQAPTTAPDAPPIQTPEAAEEILAVASPEPLEPVPETTPPMTVEEPVITQEPVVPEEPVIAEEPVITEEPMVVDQVQESSVPEPQIPVEAVDTEPDIWDILSEADAGDAAETAEVQEPSEPSTDPPSLGALEGAGVVDVGSFEVGLDRTEGLQVEDLVTMEPDISFDPTEPPVPDGFQNGDSTATTEERSKVEERERDFFGFETDGAEKEDPGQITDAIEEITFDLEKQAASDPVPGIPGEDVSFVIPDPDPGIGQPPGDTVSPELFAPEPAPETDDEVIAEAPEELAVTEPPVVDILPEVSEPMEEQPDPQPTVISSPEFDLPDDVEEVEFTLAEEITAPLEIDPQLDDELSVSPEMEPQIPGEQPAPFTVQAPPEVDQEGSVDPEPLPDPSPVEPPQGPASLESPDGEVGHIPQMKDSELEAMVRAIVVEKVEKIAWEVIPELSEVLIKEAIEKIKSGS
ncbi:response regulator [bacterium]|nr:MAG: response regulator [bacterium]